MTEAAGSAVPVEPADCDDYGYDLAHEAQEALRVPVARRADAGAAGRGAGAGRGAPPGQGRHVDQDGDLGYDDAHEIPVRDRPCRG